MLDQIFRGILADSMKEGMKETLYTKEFKELVNKSLVNEDFMKDQIEILFQESDILYDQVRESVQRILKDKIDLQEKSIKENIIESIKQYVNYNLDEIIEDCLQELEFTEKIKDFFIDNAKEIFTN